MKLLSSFKKELILATRSFYFYIEIGFTLVILAVLAVCYSGAFRNQTIGVYLFGYAGRSGGVYTR